MLVWTVAAVTIAKVPTYVDQVVYRQVLSQAVATSLGLSEFHLITSLLSKQRHEYHRPVDTSGACIPFLVAPATITAVATLAYHNLEAVAFRQSMKFDHPGFSGESLATVPAIGSNAALGRRRYRTMAAVAATAIVAALAV